MANMIIKVVEKWEEDSYNGLEIPRV